MFWNFFRQISVNKAAAANAKAFEKQLQQNLKTSIELMEEAIKTRNKPMTRDEAIKKVSKVCGVPLGQGNLVEALEALGLLKFDEVKKVKWKNLSTGEIVEEEKGFDPNPVSRYNWLKVEEVKKIKWLDKWTNNIVEHDESVDPNTKFAPSDVEHQRFTKVKNFNFKVKWKNVNTNEIIEVNIGVDPNIKGFNLWTKILEAPATKSEEMIEWIDTYSGKIESYPKYYTFNRTSGWIKVSDTIKALNKNGYKVVKLNNWYRVSYETNKNVYHSYYGKIVRID